MEKVTALYTELQTTAAISSSPSSSFKPRLSCSLNTRSLNTFPAFYCLQPEFLLYNWWPHFLLFQNIFFSFFFMLCILLTPSYHFQLCLLCFEWICSLLYSNELHNKLAYVDLMCEHFEGSLWQCHPRSL